MTNTNQAISGTVQAVQPDGSLLVRLNDGGYGVVPPQEIRRQQSARPESPNHIIGRNMHFLCTDAPADGPVLLSARAYEEQVYQKICSDFHAGLKNVYPARLTSVTPDGKLAFYRLAQGVSGALHVSALCLARVHSFREINVPRQLTVAVSSIDSRGFISLSSKPAFGDFSASVRRLALTEGCTAEGVVSSLLSDGAVSVMLAPNLVILADARFSLRPGEAVRLRIRRIDHEQRRIRALLTDRIESPAPAFPYECWSVPADELPAWIDLAEFDRLLRPVRPSPPEPREPGPAPVIEYSVTATRSPFSSYANERIVREARRNSRLQDITFEARMGYLNERHLKTAQTIESLKYSSAWQVRRFLHLRHGLALSDRELKGIIDRLVKHDIIAVLRFQSDEGSLLTRVLHPSINYHAFCGERARAFAPRDFIEEDPVVIKTRLASNQLLIALLHSHPGIELLDTHPFLSCEETGARVRPRHIVAQGSQTRCLEAVRASRMEEFREKLLRYEQLWTGQKADTGVIVSVEDHSLVAPTALLIGEMHLSYPVWLTDDLGCLPEPTFICVPPEGKEAAARPFPAGECDVQPQSPLA